MAKARVDDPVSPESDLSAAEELRLLADADLVAKLREAKDELFRLRFQTATGQLDNNRRLSAVRHEIARIYTVMRQRELGIDARGRFVQ